MLFSGASLTETLVSMAYRIPALLIGLSFHEAAHAYMAYRCGDPTARNLGRMSLDPLRHLDVVGTLSLLFFGFGWAKPVPVNSRNFRKPRRDDIFVSLAGIVTNLVLAFLFTGIFYLILSFNLPEKAAEITETILIYIIYINIILAVFNLIPIPPLDGYHVLRNSVRGGERFFAFLERYGFIILIGFLLFTRRSNVIFAVARVIAGIFESFFQLFF